MRGRRRRRRYGGWFCVSTDPFPCPAAGCAFVADFMTAAHLVLVWEERDDPNLLWHAQRAKGVGRNPRIVGYESAFGPSASYYAWEAAGRRAWREALKPRKQTAARGRPGSIGVMASATPESERRAVRAVHRPARRCAARATRASSTRTPTSWARLRSSGTTTRTSGARSSARCAAPDSRRSRRSGNSPSRRPRFGTS